MIKILRAWYDPAVGGFYIEGESIKALKDDVLKRLIPLYELVQEIPAFT